MLKKRKWVIIAVVLFLALAGGAYYYYASVKAASAVTADEHPMQTAVAKRGSLVITASGSGSVAPVSEIGLAFDESGMLVELNIGVGSKVQAGNVLAKLQTENSLEEIAASISDAELAVIQSQQAIADLVANAGISKTEALNNIATYAQAVRDAQYDMENYIMPAFLQGLETIEGVDKTKEALDKAWAAFEPYKFYPRDNDTRADLLETVNQTQADYDAAVKRLSYEYVLDVAQANLIKARQDYAKYENGPAADELAMAEAELKNAQDKLALAKQEQSVIELITPIDGTVMSVDASIGETLSASSFLTIADLEHLQIEVYLDESDLGKAMVGNEAEVIFDALPDQTFTGKVVMVSPGLETVDNVQAVKVVVLLDDAGGVNLPVGLNASVDVISGRAENAVLVPIAALRELDPDEYGVFVVENGQPVFRVVQVGLQDITYVEIKSGVEVGDTVTTGITKAQ